MRADIWAFGIVLLQMLTGKRGFDGDTTLEVLSNVLKADPDWTALPPATSPLHPIAPPAVYAEGSAPASSRYRGCRISDRRSAQRGHHSTCGCRAGSGEPSRERCYGFAALVVGLTGAIACEPFAIWPGAGSDASEDAPRHRDAADVPSDPRSHLARRTDALCSRRPRTDVPAPRSNHIECRALSGPCRNR